MLLSTTGGRPPEDFTRAGQDLPVSPGNGLEDAPAGTDLTEAAEAEELTVAHVHGAGAQQVGDGRWRHGGYLLLGGTLTARHWLERKVRRSCEALARDQGYTSYRDLPQSRRGLTRRLAEVDAAASLMWASGVTAGRLVDRYFDVVSVQRKLARELGLQRVLKSANVLTLDEILTRRDGEAVAP